VTLSGTGSGSGSGDGYGVSGSGPLSAGVSVTITGTGAGSGQRNGGVSLGTSVTAGSSGNITITGTGSANSSQYGYGVYIQDAVSAGGNVTITGTGGGMGTENLGVGLASSVTAGSSITIYGTGSATATGNGSGVGISGPVTAGVSITIIGKGQGAGTHDSGVVLFGDVQSGTSGNVTIRGAASASATYDNDGVDIGAGVSAGGGVTITGTGNGMATGIFDGANDGVVISGSTTVVAAVNGALTISGSSGSTGGPFELGVLIENGAQVEVTGTGPLTITGTSGQGPENYASGVEVDSAGTAILGSSGGITIKGTSRSSGTGSRGVSVEFGALIQAASTGAVSLTGQAASSMPAIYFDNGNNSELKVDTGNVTLTGNVIDLGQGNSIFSTTTSGLSHLAFQAYTYGRAIVIGAGSDVPNALTFTTTDIGAIAQGGSNDGFGLITIGSASGGNPMSLGAITTSFKTNLSLQARGGLTMPVITVLPPPGYEPLSVTGTVDLNSDPLYLVAPNSSPGNGFPSNLIHATEGTDGTTFLGQPEGSIVTDSAGNAYTISYQADGNTEVQLLSITLPKPNPPSPGAGTGRGRG
jgi:hypothetical protein